MELLLNLIWLALALWSAAQFTVWAASCGAGRRQVCLVAIALVCILALLLPIISITDDLHMKKAVVEEAKRPALVALMPAGAFVVSALIVVAVVWVAMFALPACPSTGGLSFRGPPV